MSIIGAAGLAQNFAAIKSLITSGIQVGHMKMHLINILNSLGTDEYENTKLIDKIIGVISNWTDQIMMPITSVLRIY